MKKLSQTLCILLFILSVCATTAAATVIPGGQVIGLQLCDDTVTITDFHETLGDAARSAGLCKGDRILRIDHKKITDAEDIRSALAASDGQVDITVQRGKQQKTLTLCPPATADGPRLGIYLRQGTTGLGTVTYYDPQTGAFACLGHGVNAPEGDLLKLKTGSAYTARIFSVKKGKAGAPGQLSGSITSPTAVGSLQQNTQQGVFGKLTQPIPGDALPTATAAEIKTGAATIRSTVGGETLREYSVEILKIYPNTSGRTRNLLLKVTDPELLQATGGIVQGMSGSPIIQDGKLVGAVTHVLVNDPTRGYGIFIENMLDATS